MAKRAYSQYLKKGDVPIGVVLTLLLGLLLIGRELHWLPQSYAAEVAPPNSAYTLLPSNEMSGPATAQSSSSDTCKLSLVPITSVQIGISNQPTINKRGDRVGFWSTANLPVTTRNNLDGNIEIFLSKVGAEFSQVTDSRGSILGGFNLSPSMDSTGTKVVFFSDRDLTPDNKNADSNFEIFLAQISTTGVTITQVTNTTGGANILPSVSADGTRIAFISDRDLTGTKSNDDKNLELFVAQLTPGSAQPTFIQVTNTDEGLNDQPAISADGNSIAFISDHNLTGQNADGNLEIFRAELTSTGITMLQVTNSVGRSNDRPSIDDNGSDITFVADSGTGGRYQVWLVKNVTATSAGTPLIINGAIPVSSEASPSISDDGTRIVFASESTDATASRLYLYDSVLGGLIPDPLTGTGGNAEQPAMSGSGANIVFISDHEGRRQVYLAECPLAELRVEKSIAKNPVVAGEMVTYTLTTTNNGPSTANNVIMSDTLPTKIQLGTISVNSSLCSVSGRTVSCNFGDMLVDTTQTVTVVGYLDPLQRGQLTNSAIVTSSTYDRNLDDNTSTIVTNILAQVTLAVTKVDTPDPVVAGRPITYTVTIKNTGFSTGTGIRFTDTLPTAITLPTFVAPAGASCALNGSTLTCTLANLVKDATATIRINGTVNPAARGSLSNTALATALEDQQGEQATATTTITTLTNLALSKSDSPDPVFAGQLLTYTLTATNNGPSTANNVRLTDPLPTNFLSAVATAEAGKTCSVAVSTNTLTCQLGILAPGQSTTVVVSGQVAPLARTNLSNTARLVSTENTVGVQDTETTTVQTKADLILTKSDSPDPVIAGEYLTYTLNVTNNGPSAATSIVLTDTFSGFLTSPQATFSQGSCPINDTANTMICNLGTINPGSSVTIRLSGQVDPSARTSMSNSATVRAQDFDPDLSTNTASASTAIETEADLSLTKVANPSPVVAGEMLTYTLVLTNEGPSTATDITLEDTLAATFNSPSAIPTQGTCPIVGSVVTCDLNNLSPGNSITVTITGTVDEEARVSLANTATASAIEPDPDSTNNTASVSTTIQTEVDLIVTKSDSPDPVIAGNTLTYYITVTNAGPSSATSVVLTDNLSTSLVQSSITAVTNQGDSCSVAAFPVITCSLGTILDGSSETVTITGTVNETARTSLSNTASVSATETETASSSNSTTISTSIITRANIAVTKADGPDPVVAGQTVYYTLTVTNNGPSTATNIVLSDTLPSVLSSLTLGTGTSTGTNCTISSGRLTCNITQLLNGATKTIYIRGTVASTARTSMSNTVTVSGTETDLVSSNNSATQATSITAKADLGVTKVDSPDPVIAGQQITYTIRVTNSGPSQATSIKLTDTLPTGSNALTSVSVVSSSNMSGCVASSVRVTCNVSNLLPNGTASLVIRGTVPSTARGSLSNRVDVKGLETDSNTSNDFDIEGTTITTQSELIVTKVDSPDPVIAGEEIAYTIRVTNTGPSQATSIKLTDTLPSYVPGTLTIVSTSNITSCPTASGGQVLCNVSNLLPGATAVLTFKGTVIDSARNSMSNSVTVRAVESDPTLTANTQSATTDIDTLIDLAVSKVDVSDPVYAGERITYTIQVTNTGPSQATGIKLTDTLPSVVGSVVAQSTTGISCVTTANPVLCTVNNLSAGGTATLTLSGTAAGTARGDYVNTVKVNAVEPESSYLDNEDTETTTVEAIALLTVSKVDTVDPVVAGQKITYTIKITNSGPSETTSTMLTDTLPSEVTSVTSSGTGFACTYYSGTSQLLCNVTNLVDEQTRTLTVYGTITSTARNSITNTVTISSLEMDASSVSTDSEVTTLSTKADLVVTKTDTLDPVVAGEWITYTIEVGNAGPSEATGIKLTDTLPSEVYENLSVDTGCLIATTVTCDVPDLLPGETATLTISGSVTSTARSSITNAVTVSAVETDPDTADNTDSEDTAITASAALAITKSAPALVIAGDPITYTITITNNGPSSADVPLITDTLSTKLSTVGVTATSTEGSCTPGAEVTCTMNQLLPGESAEVTIIADVLPLSRISVENEAQLSSGESSVVTSNQTSTVIEAVADLSVSKSVSSVAAGQTVTYTLEVNHTGPATATDVWLTDTLPSPLTNVTLVSGTGCTPSGMTISCYRATLDPEPSTDIPWVITVTADLPATASGWLTNDVTVTSVEDTVGVTDTVTSAIIRQATLQMTKVASATSINAGETMTYTLYVTNTGPSTAKNLNVTDVLSASLNSPTVTTSPSMSCSVSASAPYSVSCGPLTELAVGSAAVVTIVTEVDEDADRTSVSNDASATATEDADGVTSNTVSTTITSQATLDLRKTANVSIATSGDTVQYTLTITNSGPSSSRATVLTDLLPNGAYYNDAASSASCSTSSINPPLTFLSSVAVTCNLGTLPTGVTTVIISAELRASGTNTNTATVTSTEDPSGDTDSANVQVSAGSPYRLGFSTQPTTTVAGVPFTVTLEVQDFYGNKATDTTTREVRLGLDENGNGNGATLQPVALPTVTASNGVFTFTDIYINETNTISYTLTATETLASGEACPTTTILVPDPFDPFGPPIVVTIGADCLVVGTVTSDGFDIVEGVLTNLVFETQPVDAEVGESISPPIVVSLRDAYGNLMKTWTTPITLTVENDPNGNSPFYVDGAIASEINVIPTDGIVTFTTGITITKPGVGFTLKAQATDTISQTSAAFAITSTNPSVLVFTQHPTNELAGAIIAPTVTVEARDPYGNVVTAPTGGLQLTLSVAPPNPAAAVLAGTTTLNVAAGSQAIYSFDNISITKAYTDGYTLRATMTSPALITDSQSFIISPAAAYTITFEIQPTDTARSEVINSQIGGVKVALWDVYGNLKTDSNAELVLDLRNENGTLSPTPSGFLDGTDTCTVTASGYDVCKTLSGGVATFTDLKIDAHNDDPVTIAAALDGASATLVSISDPFNNNAADSLDWIIQPTDATAGDTLSVVSVRTMSGTVPVPSYGRTVTMTVYYTPTTGGPVMGTLTAQTVNGIATFNNLYFQKAGADYQLQAVASSLVGSGVILSGPSDPFTITHTTLDHLAFTVEPTSVDAGTNQSVTVVGRDIYDNLITTAASNLQLTLGVSNTVGAVISGTTTLNVSAGSPALFTFNPISITKSYTDPYTLLATMTSPVLTTESQAFTISPAAAYTLTFEAQPTTTVRDEIINYYSGGVKVAVRDQYNNILTDNDSYEVVLGLRNSSGALPAPGTATTLERTDADDCTVAPSDYQVCETVTDGIAIFSTIYISSSSTSVTNMTLLAAENVASPSSKQSSLFNASTRVGYIVFDVQPTNGTAGTALSSVVVRTTVSNADSTTISSNGRTITMTVASSTPSGGTVSGTYTAVTVNGVATFTNLIFTKMATYTIRPTLLTASGLTLNGATSNSFFVTHAAASALVFTTQPPGPVNSNDWDEDVNQTVVVEVRDAYSNVVTTTTAIEIALWNPNLGGTDKTVDGGLVSVAGTTTSDATAPCSGGNNGAYEVCVNSSTTTGQSSFTLNILDSYGGNNTEANLRARIKATGNPDTVFVLSNLFQVDD